MRRLIFIIPVLFLCVGMAPLSFRDRQLNYTRVRMAYACKEKKVVKNLTDHSIVRDNLRIYLRAFKEEKIIEIWARNATDTVFIPVQEIPICDISGDVGPKRRSHDMQVPEGFYRIIDLNPYSKYFLSIQINYPNASDSIRGTRGRLGNEIFIHGDCISSGCMAITDDKIQELFVYCIEAYNSGQKNIEMAIYPERLTDSNYARLTTRYSKYKDEMSLWADLKKSYDLFDTYKMPPSVKFLANGTHEVNPPLRRSPSENLELLQQKTPIVELSNQLSGHEAHLFKTVTTPFCLQQNLMAEKKLHLFRKEKSMNQQMN